MSREPDLGAILDPRTLPLPERPKVVEIRARPHVDGAGDPALLVSVILESPTYHQEWNARVRWEFRRAILDALREGGDERFPYVEFGTRSELERRTGASWSA